MINFLDKIDPRFRQLTDLLLFSDRMDIDLKDFHKLLKRNYNEHFCYFWDRFKKACDIFWEDGERFWYDRLFFIFSLNDKLISKNVEDFLEKRMVQLIIIKGDISPKYDVEHMQYLQLCHVKHVKGENLNFIRNFFIDLTPRIRLNKLIKIVQTFIPTVFKNLEDYAQHLMRKMNQSSSHFLVLLALEEYGVEFNNKPIIDLTMQIIMDGSASDKSRRTLFSVLDEPKLKELVKERYKVDYRPKLLSLISECDYREIEDRHLGNIKNLIDLDPGMADELAIIYSDKLLSRTTGHRKANADRLIRLIKNVPQISSKKVLAHLSFKNKMIDIKHILVAFPELRKLAAFV